MSTVNVNRVVDASGGVLAPISSVMRNRIINGAMVIDQRNAGASVATSSGVSVYTVDRWVAIYSQTSKFTIQQNAGSVTPPNGFKNYLGVTSSSAYSIGSTDFFIIRQAIEGFNVADLGWGTASASSVSISFWIRSSLTGTFGAALMNSAANRSYPFTYTISAANTWEQKTVTVAGDTSGTWLSDNGVGLYIQFGLGIGSTYSGTSGTWTGTSNIFGATGATSVVGTNGATFYITGVQLEVGTQATSFEYRQYQQELQLCQRYYWKTDSSAGAWNYIGSGVVYSSTLGFAYTQYPVLMRSAPTISTYGTVNSTNVQLIAGGVATGVTAVAGAGATETNPMSTRIDFTTSGATGGQGCLPRLANGVGVTFSAEL